MQMQSTLSTEHMVQCSGHALLRPNHSHSGLLYIYLSSQIPSGDYGPAAETTGPLVLSRSKLRQSDENTSLLCCSAKTTGQIKIELTISICQLGVQPGGGRPPPVRPLPGPSNRKSLHDDTEATEGDTVESDALFLRQMMSQIMNGK